MRRGQLGMARCDAGHHPVGNEPETDRRNAAGDHQSSIKRVHDLAANAGLDEKAAHDRSEYGKSAECKRIGHRGFGVAGQQQRAEQHGGDDCHRVRLEQIGRHAGAIADVVAHVVGDDRGIARIVFGNAGFHLADEIGADIRALGEYSAAQPRENRDQRPAEGKPHQRFDGRMQALAHHVWRVRRRLHQEQVKACDAEQPQPDDQ